MIVLKKVILLGDSIKAFYAKRVRKLLEGKCEVYSEDDNGRFTYYSVRQLMEIIWKHGTEFDLVHFNCGYWDMTVMPILNRPMMSLEEYQSGLKKIIELSRATGAKLIFATTTPLPGKTEAKDTAGTDSHFVLEQDRVKNFNEAALEVMKAENITVNDLYAVCKQDKNFYKCEDNLHHTDEGNDILARHVADAILKELGLE